MKGETVGEESEKPLCCVQMGCYLFAVEMAVEGWFEVFEKSLELVEVHVKTGHVMNEEIAETVVVH